MVTRSSRENKQSRRASLPGLCGPDCPGHHESGAWQRASLDVIHFVCVSDRRNHRRLCDRGFHGGTANRTKRSVYGLGARALRCIPSDRVSFPASATRGRFSRSRHMESARRWPGRDGRLWRRCCGVRPRASRPDHCATRNECRLRCSDGWMFLGEALSVRRIFACLIVAAGAILLGL